MVERAGFEPTKREARQIYSLLPLTTRPSLHGDWYAKLAKRLAGHLCPGAQEGTRTPNLLFTKQLRCQLRYPGPGQEYPARVQHKNDPPKRTKE